MRAESVARRLLAMGVPVSDLQIAGVGERSVARQTKDGVREPQSRRVVVQLAPGN